jgi:ABC-2 type transport system ATP-binding protein
MQQRLGLARVLVHDPKILLLDEPASGLDPRARIEIRALLKELRKMGKTILISSHILADIADLCNKIALIEKGQLVYAGGIREAMERVQTDDVWVVEVADEIDRAQALISRLEGVHSVEAADGQLVVKLHPDQKDPSTVPHAIMAEGLRLLLFRRAEVTLEDAFMKLTKGEVS